MADLEKLLSELTPEATPNVDWDAPEQGQYPPDAPPGDYEFIFHLPADTSNQFDQQVVDKVPYLQVNFNAELVANGDGQPLSARDDGSPRLAAFQRASFYKKGSMPISFGGELMRCLGLRVEGQLSPPVIVRALQQADGRARGKATFAWRTYFKDTETTVSTSPRKRKGDVEWPKQSDGTFEPMAVDPKTGKKQFGRLEIIRYYLPK